MFASRPLGQPKSYLGATLTWEGRELTSYSNDDYTLNYEYDENGMRYRTTVLRTVIDEETNEETLEETNFEYVWADGKLVSLIYTNEDASGTAKYLYNEFDEPIGIVYSDASGFTGTYYYLKNAQGDITCVVDGSGKKQISFTYDAFGEVTECYHATNVTTFPGFVELMVQKAVRLLTPFGYRGYCYDTFTGLYYLQSRYYDPNVGRFINADDTNYLNATGTVLGCNLFAYCENDPVNKVDYTGTISLSKVFGATSVVSAILSALATITLLAFRNTPWGSIFSAIIAAAGIAANVYSYFSAINSAKKYYGEKSTNYKNIRKYNNILLIINVAAIIIGEILGKYIIKKFRDSIALALIGIRHITIIGLSFSAAELLTGKTLYYRNRVRR